MDSDLLGRADMFIGDRIEAVTRAHHRRRLARAGWGRAFEPSSRLWADGDTPPRRGNDVEILIDGAGFLPRLADELERAESHVHIAGWYLSTELALVRENGRRVLLDLLEELARKVEVRVLLWAGPPLPLFRPSRSEVRDVAKRIRGGPRSAGTTRRRSCAARSSATSPSTFASAGKRSQARNFPRRRRRPSPASTSCSSSRRSLKRSTGPARTGRFGFSRPTSARSTRPKG